MAGTQDDSGENKFVDYYQDYYVNLLKRLDELMEDGETDPSRVLNILDREHIALAADWKLDRDASGSLKVVPIAAGEVIPDALSLKIRAYRPTLFAHGLFQAPPYSSTLDALPNLTVEYLNAYPIDAVVDMGGGYGRGLFATHLLGSRRDVKYYCMDTSRTAQQMFERMKGLCPGFDVEYVLDNYTTSDFSFLAGAETVLLMTRGVIILTPSVPEEAIERWTQAAKTVHGVHLEPIGFQIKISNPTFDSIGNVQRGDAREKGKNTDFMEHLVAQRDKGNLALLDIRPHMFHEWEPYAPKSLLTWVSPTTVGPAAKSG